jgi:hypothetical protein
MSLISLHDLIAEWFLPDVTDVSRYCNALLLAMFFTEAYFKYRFRFFKITDSMDNNLQILLSSVQPLKN